MLVPPSTSPACSPVGFICDSGARFWLGFRSGREETRIFGEVSPRSKVGSFIFLPNRAEKPNSQEFSGQIHPPPPQIHPDLIILRQNGKKISLSDGGGGGASGGNIDDRCG